MLHRNYLLSVGHIAILASLGATQAHAQNSGPATVLDPINVQGASDDTVLDNFDGYSAEAASSATRIPGDLQTTPRSVTVVGQEQMQDQGIRSLEQAITYAPGVTTQTYGNDGRYDQYAIRGFDAQNSGHYRDGLPLRTFYYSGWRTEPFMVERVEVLRGPTADLYGSNEPGGLVNAITKRPEFDFGATVRGSVFDEGGSEIAGDVTGPLSTDLAYRMIGVFNDSGTEFDAVDQGRILFAPSITWQPSETTRLTLFGQYQKDDIADNYVLRPQYGTQERNPLGPFDEDIYPNDPDRNTIESEQSYLGYELEQDLGTNLTWLSRARFARNEWFNKTSYASAFLSTSVDPQAVNAAYMIDFDVDETADHLSFDNGLKTELGFGLVNATVIAGVDYFQAEIDTELQQTGIGVRDLASGVLILPEADPVSVAISRNEKIRQTGLYLLTSTEVGDNIVLNGGIRHDFIDREGAAETNPSNDVSSTSSLDNKQDVTSASIGASYTRASGLTVYGNAARSFNLPPAGFGADGEPLDVEKSVAFEVGTRFRPVGTGSLFTLAVFDITKTNVAQYDNSTQGYEQVGEVRSRGLELGATHRFDNGVSLVGSYTYLDAEITDNDPNEGHRFGRVPENTAALWVNYDVPTPVLAGLSLGAGVRYVDERYSDNANNQDYKVPESTVFDASARYAFNDWEAALAVRNVADEREVTYCYGGAADVVGQLDPAAQPYAGGCALGEGRTITLSLTRTF